MTALPIHNAKAAPLQAAPLDSPIRARIREDRTGMPPRGALITAAIIAAVLLWVAGAIAAAGWLWAALPIAVLAVAIVLGAILPELLAARWDRA